MAVVAFLAFGSVALAAEAPNLLGTWEGKPQVHGPHMGHKSEKSTVMTITDAAVKKLSTGKDCPFTGQIMGIFIQVQDPVLCSAQEDSTMRDQDTLHQCYMRAFEGEAGKAVLEDIEARAHMRETSFSPDPQRTAFNEGKRSLALHIRRMLETESVGRTASQEKSK